MGEDEELIFFAILLIHLRHIGIHHRADVGACGEKIFRHIHFSLKVLLRHRFPILISETERLNIAQYRQAHVTESGYHPRKREVKSGYQKNEKENIEQPLSFHCSILRKGNPIEPRKVIPTPGGMPAAIMNHVFLQHEAQDQLGRPGDLCLGGLRDPLRRAAVAHEQFTHPGDRVAAQYGI